MNKKAAKTDIATVEYALADLDPADGETSDAAKARYLAQFENTFEPKPTAVIDSGNGIQCLWRLKKRITLGEPTWVEKQVTKNGETKTERVLEFLPEDQAKIDDVEARVAAVMLRLGSKAGTQNIDRILRLPGTTNLPNAKKRRQGRGTAATKLIEFNGATVRLEDLPKDAAGSGGGKDTGATFDPGGIEVIEPGDPPLARLAPKWIKVAHEGDGIDPSDRSKTVFAFTCECVRADVPDAATASCLMHWKIGEHVRDQGDVMRAIKRTIGRAHEFVKDSTLFKMNEKHCVLPIGGKTRVATWGDDPNFPGRETITMFSSIGDFRALHDKYRYEYRTQAGETQRVGLGTWWVKQPGRRQHDGGMRFMPTRDEDLVDGTLNLWRGFAVPARRPEGKSGAEGCKLFLDHGLKVICSGNEAHFEYLIKREAWIAKHRRRSETAVALRTEEEGTGKGVWARTIGRLYGRHSMQLLRPEHVVGKFNPHLESLLMVIADEAMFVGDPRHRNVLHGLITEPVIPIERKFVDVYNAENYLNLYTLSNSPHLIDPGIKGGRRYLVPTVSSEHASDHDYFRKIMVELEDEAGYEALLYHLLHEIDLRDFNVRDVPKTAGLAEQAAYSRKGVDLLVEKACSEAIVPCGYELRDFSSTTAVTNNNLSGLDYFIDHHPDRELSRLGALRVKRRLAQEWGCTTNVRKMINNVRLYGVFWPPLKELRAKFEAKHGRQDWPNPETEEWQECPTRSSELSF